MADESDRVRERAYFLWLEEGCPDGQAERHWLAAETLIEADSSERTPIESEPAEEPAREFACGSTRSRRGRLADSSGAWPPAEFVAPCFQACGSSRSIARKEPQGHPNGVDKPGQTAYEGLARVGQIQIWLQSRE